MSEFRHCFAIMRLKIGNIQEGRRMFPLNIHCRFEIIYVQTETFVFGLYIE